MSIFEPKEKSDFSCMDDFGNGYHTNVFNNEEWGDEEDIPDEEEIENDEIIFKILKHEKYI